MTANNAQARGLIRHCRQLRESGAAEAALRSEIMSRLRSIFPCPEDNSWINHYSQGTETRTTVGRSGGMTANRFIDNLVGSTTIEYESDLRISSKYQEGRKQVMEHTSGLVRAGTPISHVRGILSDTVDWHAYGAHLAEGVQPTTCSADDIVLEHIDSLLLDADDQYTADRLIAFIRRHLAREQSMPLHAASLKDDFGLDSDQYRDRVDLLIEIVEAGRATNPSVRLATDLWSEFVDHLESTPGDFRVDAYADEIYLCVLARLLAANVLHGRPISGDIQQLETILDGTYFHDNHHLENMVEQDYFWWLTNPEYIDNLAPIARDIQRDLSAYDFGHIPDEDLFGQLMAQLADRSQRRLLGQEWTPAWLGKLLAERCLDNLPKDETPRIIDMCCGSGSILAEVLKAVRRRTNLVGMSQLQDVATGFDIDPLAVSLAKTTWIMTLASEISSASGQIIIPIYHADSLFAVTPVSNVVPLFGEDGAIDVSLDGEVIKVPSALVQPEYRDLFERIIDWAHDEAMDAKARGNLDQITQDMAERFMTEAGAAINAPMPADLKRNFCKTVLALAGRMSKLAIDDRNGIWAFILRNTYRPGLLTGQFNGLVSNPPWLTMSRLADNPYRSKLAERARLYGIQPTGQSFLHLELCTTHLIHAVDRYLKPNASIACLVPGTVFNGTHHEPFRQQKFLTSQRPVPIRILEVWGIAQHTFKYPGGAIIGLKKSNDADSKSIDVAGFVAGDDSLEHAIFSEIHIGTTRTAWMLRNNGQTYEAHDDSSRPKQGADIMPRVATCVEILDEHGSEYRVDTPSRGSPWGFTVKSAKITGERFPGYVEPRFIYTMAQSENLLPFLLGAHRAPVAIPAIRDSHGEWTILEPSDIRRLGFTPTARRFQSINEWLDRTGNGKTLQERIDERGKLTQQRFGSEGYLVLAGAGGKDACAACIPVEDASRMVIDQTLYWQVTANIDKAWYLVGILNSHAMSNAIAPYNPKGAFGERHIHTLPYQLMPTYDSSNTTHIQISMLSRGVARMVLGMVTADEFLQDPSRALHSRRRKLRKLLVDIPEYQDLEHHCSVLLNITERDGHNG